MTADLIDKPPEDVSTFQGMIAVLQAYWAKQGCIVQQPYDMEMGAGTFHASTFLRAIGPEPWHVCHTQGSRRPTDGRYGENPNRLQHYYQFQVAMKPSPVNMQDLYLGSLEALGFDLLEDDVRFVEDNWESPTLGAWGLGWEVWLNGMEVTQYTYFQQCGGLPCAPVLGELAYGIERLAMYIQGVESVYDLVWGVTPAGTITYGDVFHQNEVEQSAYNFEHADTDELFHGFDVCEANCQRLVEQNLPLPAYEQVLRGSHTFNLLDARHAISVTERQRYILRVRGMSRAVAESYLQSREQLGFPLLRSDNSHTDKSAETMPQVEQADSGQASVGNSSDDQASLLIEIGVEELPAGSALPMARYLGSGLHDLLQANDFEPGTYKVFSTPRRLAVLVASVRSAQSDRDVEKRGPALSAAYDAEGKPSKALSGFARSCGVEPEKLERMKTDKGEWLVYRSSQQGQALAQFIGAHLPKLMRQMPMPKRMRWSDKDVEFLRPVLWLMALHGKNVLQLELLSQAAGRETHGHRFHARHSLQLESADSYESQLADAFVIADFDKRREVVVQQVEACAKEFGASVVMDDNLVDEVTSLVEWPVALTGRFDEHFLELPKEALIQTMEENQRYFALLDNSGALLPGFITVANIESKNTEKVRQGNERVIRPRFSDTMFFWKNDVAKSLESHRDALDKVLFQKKLGSVLDKTKRLESLASVLAGKLAADKDHCVRAAALSKCDLLTEIVTELPKMQGIAGRYYAQIEGEPADVSQALQDQYLPIKSGGELPDSLPGQILAIADKTDTLVGIFGIGQRPTGAKDPFGLRRASVGLLRIIIEKGLELDLRELLEASKTSFGERLAADFALDDLLDYILERLRSYYQEQGARTDVVDAVMARHITRPVDFDRRVQAIAAFRETDAAASLSAANKRIQNILKKVETAVPESINQELLTESAEKSLASDLQSIASELAPQFEAGNYAEAMRSTAKLRPAVDAFFDNVMVMVDDEPVRNNRLALLQQVGELCSHTADLSRLQLQES